jgi:hypothetical protein
MTERRAELTLMQGCEFSSFQKKNPPNGSIFEKIKPFGI